MNRRIVQEILPVIVIGFLNDWLLRVFILVSLFSQIELLLLGNRRKYTPGNWLRSIIWQAYTTKDAIIDISIGVLFTCQGASEDNSSQQNDMIKAFWLPFLLLHLGGPDTITAFSLEDNELWIRQFIQLLLKFVWASSIFLRSWKSRPLNIITIPMFVTGLIKYGEKTWYLRTRTGPVPVPVPVVPVPVCACATFMAGYNGLCCAAFMTECDCKKAEDIVFHASQKLQPLCKRLLNSSQVQAFIYRCPFEVIEIELGFIYDIFYTKPMKVYDEWGLVRRFICLFSEISTFIGFMIIDKHEYSTTDVIITWLLLVGAIVQEIYSIILLCSSDWTINWLNKQGKTRLPTTLSLPANKRWSDSMARYNLISYSLKNLPIKFSEVWKFFCIPRMLDECSSKNSDVPKYLKKLIFEQLQEKSRHAPGIKEAKELCARRGDWALEKMNCFSRLGWSTGGDFDKSILLWHLATDLCYCTDLNKKSSPTENSNREASKLLSDYMVYLLVKRPVMLPNGIGQIRFQDSCSEATEIFQCVKDRIQACKRLFLQPPLKVKGDRSKSVLSDACRLAKSLQSLETEEEWNCEKKWEMMSHVWVEMLCYAACHCPRNRHAEELTNGGELLTHVWLLMAHFGITEHVYLD
ncbi:hypothetical protein AAG906_012502 [Vitis piasezkii]